uniref:Uncharacterized protein n=1 Tax=Pipistrellus kuhlii TaxID=59472 RepID=A0A7J7W2Z8_PIPKU|nr:hypothetical protein mPipKuh1_008154 [Pipistrellus kuhlii]
MFPRPLHASHFRGRRAGLAEPSPRPDLALRTPEAGRTLNPPLPTSPPGKRPSAGRGPACGRSAVGPGRRGSQFGGGRGSPQRKVLHQPPHVQAEGGSRSGPPGGAFPRPLPPPSPRPVLGAAAAA